MTPTPTPTPGMVTMNGTKSRCLNKCDVVISGASGRFPASSSMEQFKDNLFNSVDMVTEDDSRWPIGLWNLPGRNGKMPNLDRFDTEFFGYTESDTVFMDPQERLLLEETYEAIIDAGVDPDSLKGTKTGFFFGSCFQETHTQFDDPTCTPEKIRTMIARVSRFFQLKGPIVQTDTACGSSFSALNEAFHAMKSGICDQIICAGSNTLFRPRVSLQFRDLKMITRDGKCKCLDQSANGYVRSEASVVFLLQKRQDAKRIYCTILNSKSNSDGYKLEGITFPSQVGQRRLVSEVYQEVGIDPASINYIEAHVTGTKAGDPVEMNAMYDVICANKTSKNPLHVGCLKSNMGHTEGASGLCSIAKTLLIFQTKKIPPNLHFISPNPNIKGLMDNKMVPVNTITPFTGSLIPVNCFGFGGANVHVLAECFDGPTSGRKVTDPIPRLVQVSGRTLDSINFVFHKLMTRQEEYLTPELLSLLDDFSNLNHKQGMKCRGYGIITENRKGQYVLKQVTPTSIRQKPVTLIYPDTEPVTSSSISQLMQLNPYKESMAELEDIVSRLKGTPSPLLSHVMHQVALTDLLFSIGVTTDHVRSIGSGIIAGAYRDGCLNREESIAVSLLIASSPDVQSIHSQLDRVLFFPKKMSQLVQSIAGDVQFTADYLIGQLKGQSTMSLPLDSVQFIIGTDGIIERGIDDVYTGDHFLNVIHSLGRLFMNGSGGKVAPLYPTLTYPLPSSTGTLSNLIMWNHEKCYPLAPFLVQSFSIHFQFSRDLTFHFDRRHQEDAFLFDHKIDGRILFPATGYLMMAWIALAKLNNVSVYDSPIEFSDVSFERATVMSPVLTKLTIRVNEDSGGFVIKEGDNIVARGSVRFLPDRRYIEPVAVRLNPPPADCITMETKDLYKEFRTRGYDYGQYFQPLNKTRSDGRQGHIVWRDVLSKGFKDSMDLETDEDHSLLWMRSWVTFSDAMFQLLLLSQQDLSRNLFVPRKVESIIVYPETLKANITESTHYQDYMTMSDASELTCFADPDENLVWTKGFIIKGLKTSLLKRRQQYVRHKKYFFTPTFLDHVLDDSGHLMHLQGYMDECIHLSGRINRGEMGSFLDVTFDVDQEEHALLRCLVNRFKGGKRMDCDMSRDLIVGTGVIDWMYPELFLKPHLERLVYNCIDGSGMKMDLLEYNHSQFILSSILQSYADESLLYDQTVISYTLMHPNPSLLDPSIKSSIKEILKLDPKNENLPLSHLIVYRNDTRDINVHHLMEQFFKATRDSGFLLIISKDVTRNPELDKVTSTLNIDSCNNVPTEQLVEAAMAQGYFITSRRTLNSSLLPMHSILLRKQKPVPLHHHHTMSIGLINYTDWMPQMREKLAQMKTDPDLRLWLVQESDQNSKDKMTGLIGFVKSIRLEPGYERVRMLLDMTQSSTPDIHDPKYGDMLQQDMVFNIWGGESDGWLQYEHMCLPRDVQQDASLMEPLSHVYLKSMKPGDLSSFCWAQSSFEGVSKESISTVYYAPLNFRDIMFATGRLQPEAIPGISPTVAQDSILGLEFAGKDCNGNRVMGVVPYKAIASTVVMSDPDLVWPIPSHWTMEEASTVPCVYATAYYALIVRGKLVRGESVLIHAGAGGVGLAAINISLNQGCRVFTSVGSQPKRDYLIKTFPQLDPKDILYSRDCTFEDDIMRITEGHGVDMVLNSLAEDKLKAGIRILAPNGRFLEIGKVDFIQDTHLGSSEMDMNRSFHGVLLDSLFRYNDDDYFPQRLVEEKKQLKRLVLQGIEDGTVQPLNRTVFHRDQMEEAFRFMSGGKHIGKVVIKMRDEQSDLEQVNLPALKSTHCFPHKSYIVIGGLGGFGLEVVTWLADRGAKNIVIGARRGVREAYQQFCLNKLIKRGVNLIISQDESFTHDGSLAIMNKALSLGPVGGIFNTAVVYEDILFDNMTYDSFRRVLEPKLLTSLHLDDLSRKMCPQLDYFVCFSSISCGRGNGGQTNYNYANSAMDSLCYSRFMQGLPGLSIQWGVVGDVGIVTEKTGSTEVNLLGATSQRLHSLMQAVDRFLQSKAPVCLSYVKAEKAGNSSGDSVDLLKMVSRIFGIKDISTLDPLASLGSLGIDSLIAVEMKQLLERVTGSSMTVKEIRDLTIATLIDLSKSEAKKTNA